MAESIDAGPEPVFEIITDSTHIKIWADGRVEGFSVQGQPMLVVNRIPEYTRRADLRDRFAGRAISGMLAYAGMNGAMKPRAFARASYDLADVMLEERKRET